MANLVAISSVLTSISVEPGTMRLIADLGNRNAVITLL
ncbi:hypothetical protein LPU83_pLPU83b_0202 (plasmid) [Rhizobium favelukesii]|uniref:Uncharacterized protein n=1 Tax=Rhizobium favelukesii TaxID=348824 RepID=W6S148_9HYPH|nr:hypothetical protein LPU83_pLPU83b_0202 [Rhizobium favelukesii]